MALNIPRSTTSILLNLGRISRSRFWKTIRSFKNTVCILLESKIIRIFDLEYNDTPPSSLEINPASHALIIDFFLVKSGIIYLCEKGCVHRCDVEKTNTEVKGPALTGDKVLSVHPFCNGFITVCTDRREKHWFLDAHALNHPKFTVSRIKTPLNRENPTAGCNESSKEFSGHSRAVKSVVICLHAVSSSDDYINSVSVETELFQQLFGQSQIFPLSKCQALLVAFPDGQVCSLLFSSDNELGRRNESSKMKLLCCVDSQVAGIFVINSKRGICVVGENGRVIILQLSGEPQNFISLQEFYIRKPVISCDINGSTIVHCDGNRVHRTSLKISNDKQESLHSSICSDIVGVVQFKLLSNLSDEHVSAILLTEDGRILKTTLDLTAKCQTQIPISSMTSTFSKIQSYSERLLELQILEEKQRSLINSLSIASTLFHSGKTSEYFDCSCRVHSCKSSSCQLTVTIKNNSPYKLNVGSWNFSCIMKWPLTTLIHETENQIIKSQPLIKDFNLKDHLVFNIAIPMNNLTSSSQFPLKIISFFVLLDSRQIPTRPIAMLQLNETIVDELCLLEVSDNIVPTKEITLKEKIWRMAKERNTFNKLYKEFPPDIRNDFCCEFLSIGPTTSLSELISVQMLTTDGRFIYRGNKLQLSQTQDGPSTIIRLNCDNLSLMAKIRKSLIKKMKKSKKINFNASSICLPHSALQSYFQVTSVLNNFYQLDTIQQMQCLVHLYYEVRNKISSKLPLI